MTNFEGKVPRRASAIVIFIASAVIAVGAVAPSASAASPCWKRVVADWQSDRVVAATYKPNCYRAALRHLPTDARTYSDAESAIKRAMLDAVRNGPTHGVKGVQTDLRQLEGAPAAVAAKRPAAPAASKDGGRLPIPMIVALTLAVVLLVAAGFGRLRARISGGQGRGPT